MNAYDEKLRPDEIERDIEQTRAQVSSTIDAIQSKLTPGQLMDQAIDHLRNSGAGDFGSNLGRAVRDNPLPVALIGVGIAWLMASGQRRDRPVATTGRYEEPDFDEGAATHGGGIRETAAGVKAKASEVVDRTRVALSSGRDKLAATGDRARAGIDGARSRMADLGDRSRDRYHQASNQVSRMIDEQPLVLGAIGVAVGAALGATLPATRREDELMGDARDDLMERVRETASAQAEAVKGAARDAGDGAGERDRREAQDERPASPLPVSNEPESSVARSPR